MPIYDPSSLGVDDNKVYFNDFDYEFVEGILFRMQRRAPTQREIREFDIAIPETNGIADFQTFIGKSYLMLQGTMYPDDENYYDIGRDMLRDVASLALEENDSSTNNGYVPYSWSQTNGDRLIYVKPLYVDIPEATTQGIVQPFRILCKIRQPIIYDSVPSGGIIGYASPSVSQGNSGLPFKLPVLLGANLYTSNGTFTNKGSLGAYPSFVITGPAQSPRITNITTGEYIEVSQNLGGSDTLTIFYDEDTITISLNGNSVYSSLKTGSTLFKMRPGDNQLSYTGTSISTGSTATVSFNSARPLS